MIRSRWAWGFTFAGLALTFAGLAYAIPGDAPAPTPLPSIAVLPIPEMCTLLAEHYAQLGWTSVKKPCEGVDWKTEQNSQEKRPLIYAEFGNPKSPNRTLVLSMVHPDEVTPLYLSFSLAQWMAANSASLKDHYVVVAPLVNPDGLFRKLPIRMNARGVDLNRNFNTKDWRERALKTWRGQLKKNPRRFPGMDPDSEPETKFQRALIEKFQPVKIMSIHAPLNVLDYDGPSSLALERFPKEYVAECLRLRNRLKARSTGFFPGSLGNFAGQERGIPTITLELPSADPKKGPEYWEKFKSGIQSMIEYKIDSANDVARNTR